MKQRCVGRPVRHYFRATAPRLASVAGRDSVRYQSSVVFRSWSGFISQGMNPLNHRPFRPGCGQRRCPGGNGALSPMNGWVDNGRDRMRLGDRFGVIARSKADRQRTAHGLPAAERQCRPFRRAAPLLRSRRCRARRRTWGSGSSGTEVHFSEVRPSHPTRLGHQRFCRERWRPSPSWRVSVLAGAEVVGRRHAEHTLVFTAELGRASVPGLESDGGDLGAV